MAARRASWWIVALPALALAYAIAVVIVAWRAPDKGFQAFTGHRIVHVEDGGIADRAGLREGDVIVAVDGIAITGTLDYAFRVLDRAPGETVALGVTRAGTLHTASLTLGPSPPPWSALVATLLAGVLLVLGLIARIGRPNDLDAQRFYRTSIIYAVVYVGALSWTRLIVHPVLGLAFLAALFSGPPIALHLSIDFPHAAGQGDATRKWSRISTGLAICLGIGCLIALSIGAANPAGGDRPLRWAVACIAVQISSIPLHTSTGLFAQLRAHRRATGVLRAQLRWLLYGHALGAIPVLAAVPIALSDLDKFLIFRYQPFVVAIAILWFCGYGLAVMRIRLADVDALIKSSLGYAVTTGAAAIVYLGVVLAAGWITGELVGDAGPWPHLVAGLAAAALFGPIRGRVSIWVDRRFFRDRQHYVEALRHAGESLALLREPAELAREAVVQLVEAVRAEWGVLFLKDGEGWSVGHAIGVGVPSEPIVSDDGFAVPVRLDDGEIVAWLVLGARKSGDLYSSDDRDLLGAIASQLTVALKNARAFGTIAELSRTLESQNAQIRELRDRLEDENRFLRKRVEAATDGASLIGDSKAMRELRSTLDRVARSDASVLVLGESGTGKGLLVRTLHGSSARAEGPFMHVDCGAIAASVFESELFGHERGAFTGATRLRRGPIELAHGGTLFLDEIGELPLELQPKLLRVLEERVVMRVGATAPVAVDVRIVAATHRNLEDMVAKGEFREDLYFRLRVIEVTVPPLRARRADLSDLCAALLPRAARRAGRPARPLSSEALARMMGYAWPGNVRELENVLERALVLGEAPELSADDLELSDRAPAVEPVEEEVSAGTEARPHDAVMDEIERRRLTAALAAANGNQSTAAKSLGMPRTTFINKLRRHGLL